MGLIRLLGRKKDGDQVKISPPAKYRFLLLYILDSSNHYYFETNHQLKNPVS